MPSLITYERTRLTGAQYHALGVYIARKKLKERVNENGLIATGDIDNQTLPSCNDEVQDIRSNSPVKPSARQIREEKRKELNNVQAQLAELELMLTKLKEKKHELFEEAKSFVIVHSKKNEGKEKQMQGFPSPFMHHPGIGPGAAMINISPYRPGIKRPKSPSPPLVQLYSPLPTSSNVQPPFPPMGPNRMPGPSENMNPGYQFQQNYPQRDTQQQIQGPQVNPPPNSPRPHGNQFPPHITHDRNFPPFGTPQMSENRMSGNVGHQNPLRPPTPVTQPPFMQQNMQQNTTTESLSGFSPPGKDRPGFSNPSGHRPAQGYTKKDGHGAHTGNRSRYH